MYIKMKIMMGLGQMFRVICLKFLGRVVTHIFYFIFSFEKNMILCILKGISPFKMHTFIFFPENLKNSRRHQ